MSDKPSQSKYQQFGAELKALRASVSRTAAEVSSAVEIDEAKLSAYEKGEQLPSEDILLLLINHFDLNEQKAGELWKLAGYKGKPSEELYFGDFGSTDDASSELPRLDHAVIGLTIQDPRIVYTDMVQIMANDHGLIMNFMQGAGNDRQPLAAAKVGMSRQHARSVLAMLKKTLDEADKADAQKNQQQAKKLPAPKKQDNQEKNDSSANKNKSA